MVKLALVTGLMSFCHSAVVRAVTSANVPAKLQPQGILRGDGTLLDDAHFYLGRSGGV